MGTEDLQKSVLYPALEYKMPLKTRLLAIALGVGIGAVIVTAMMAVIVSLV